MSPEPPWWATLFACGAIALTFVVVGSCVHVVKRVCDYYASRSEVEEEDKLV